MTQFCSVIDCSKSAYRAGMCGPHYRRNLRYGSPHGGQRASRGAGLEFIQSLVNTPQDDNCITWPFGVSDNGYGASWFEGRQTYAHRVVCILTHGAPPTPEHDAAHWCGRGKQGCVNPRHIRWATKSENQMDRVTHGTSNRGERCAAAKLTNTQAREIKGLKGCASAAELAERFAVSQATVYAIQSGAGWRWLDEPLPPLAGMQREATNA